MNNWIKGFNLGVGIFAFIAMQQGMALEMPMFFWVMCGLLGVANIVCFYGNKKETKQGEDGE